jgi:hypothetical protein
MEAQDRVLHFIFASLPEARSGREYEFGEKTKRAIYSKAKC